MFFVAGFSAVAVAAPLVHSRYKMASDVSSSETGSASAPTPTPAPIVRRPSMAPASAEERVATDDAPAEVGSWFNPAAYNPAALLAWIPGQSTYANFRSMADTRRSVGWLYDEMNFVIGAMEETAEEYRMPLQEFSWGDKLSSFTKASELGTVMSSMPTFFWIFIITLIWQFVYLADKVMDLWIDLLLYYWGLLAYVVLIAVCIVSWPEFINYVNMAMMHSDTICGKLQRTIQLHGMPATYCEDNSMNEFLREKHIDAVELLTIGEGANPMVEVIFKTYEKMKAAFDGKDALSKYIMVDGQEVRVSLKVGVNTAVVAYYEYCFIYLFDKVPERYWFRAVLSCLVTMSLASRLLANVRPFFGRLVSVFGWVGEAFGGLCASASLVFLGFYAGYHAYHDMNDAKREIDQESHEDANIAQDSRTLGQVAKPPGKSEGENSKDKEL